jgi:hypothetical protein
MTDIKETQDAKQRPPPTSDGFTETNGDLGSIRREEVIPELTYDVVAGGLSIQSLHERRLVLI